MNLAIIPARAGSKRLPDKNIMMLNGKPMMAYSIEAAIKSKVFDFVMVSTDSKEYAKVALKSGADVPFLRTIELSLDSTSTWDVISDVLKKYKESGLEFTTVTLLQPTSPLRNEFQINEAYRLYIEKNAKFIASVSKSNKPPYWSNSLNHDLSLNGFLDPNKISNSSDFFTLNGAIYIIDVEYFMNKGELYGVNSFAYKMNKQNSIDIDDEFDFLIAELLLKKIRV